MATKKQSFRELLLKGRASTEREKKVFEYICHRVANGAHFEDVIQEEYVRRNVSAVWVQYTLDNPRLVATAHEKMRDDFSSSHLNPRSSARAAQ
jgi:hypothetical protein